MKEILIATDSSDGAMRAFDYAVNLAPCLGSRVVIANIVSAIPADLFARLTAEQCAWLRETEAALSAEILRAAAARAKALGGDGAVLESRGGEIARALMDIANERNVELIVAGKRGAGRVEGILLGSVSQKLVSVSARPVLVVP